MVTPRRHILKLMAAVLFSIVAQIVSAQTNKGNISPVDSDDDAPPKPILHYYDKHGDRLEQPVLYLAELDTVKSARPSSPYPLFNGVTFGVNFIDAIMKIGGQKHQSYDISASVSLHNWFFPIVEAGIGWGDHTDNNDLYKYKAKPSFYAKAGINYNFLYKSNPDYMAYIGLRFGISHHSWDITDIKEGSDMAQETGALQLLGQSCLSVYGEAVAGLKVKIAGPLSLGWSVRYRAGQHNSHGKSPWFVPGAGTGPLNFSFSAYLTFGTRKPRTLAADAVEAVEDALDAQEQSTENQHAE